MDIVKLMLAEMPTSATQLADSWADKSDRYLFIMSLIIMGLAGFWIVRYLVARMEKQSADLADLYRDARTNEIKLIEVVANNTNAFNQTRVALENNTDILKKVEKCFDKLNI